MYAGADPTGNMEQSRWEAMCGHPRPDPARSPHYYMLLCDAMQCRPATATCRLAHSGIAADETGLRCLRCIDVGVPACCLASLSTSHAATQPASCSCHRRPDHDVSQRSQRRFHKHTATSGLGYDGGGVSLRSFDEHIQSSRFDKVLCNGDVGTITTLNMCARSMCYYAAVPTAYLLCETEAAIPL